MSAPKSTVLTAKSATVDRRTRKAAGELLKARSKATILKAPAALAQAQNTQQIAHVDKRHNAFELKCKGLSYRQIGARLGCSHVTAMNLVYEAAGERDVLNERKRPAYIAIEDERTDEVHRAMVPLVHGQLPQRTTVVGTGKSKRVVAVPHDPVEVARVQTQAAGRLVQVSARRAALFGLDAPDKLALTDPGGTRRYHDMGEAELAALVAEKRAQLGRGVNGHAVLDPDDDSDGN